MKQAPSMVSLYLHGPGNPANVAETDGTLSNLTINHSITQSFNQYLNLIIMKKLLVVLVFVFLGTVSFAQWVGTSPGNLYTTLPVGNVGIGTTAPAWTLDVTNTANFSAIIAQSPYSGAANRAVGIFRMTNTTDGQYYNISLRKNSSVFQCVQTANVTGFGVVNISLFNYATRSLDYQSGLTDVTYSNAGKFILNNTGNVGIGTTNPLAKLSVNGTGTFNGKVKCTEVEVSLTAWPDHVFKTGYNLLPLSEVENFINVNKHLPDVPSEETVLANGASLGEMNATLLQKVEELTLYMIQLQKDNDALKVRISKLEK